MCHLHQRLFFLLILLLPVQLGRHFWPEWAMVFGIRVDYLSPTIYLTDILVFLIIVTWGIFEVAKQRFRLLRRWRNHLLILTIFLGFHIFLAKNQPVAFYKLVKILEFFFLGFYVAKNQYLLSAICYPLIMAVAYSSLLAIAQFLKQASLGGFFWWLGERTFSAATAGIAKMVINGQLLMRPYATFPHPNVLAGFLLVSLILTVPFLIRKNLPLAVGYLLLTGVAIILSLSRSAWFTSLGLMGIFLIRRLTKSAKFLILNSLLLVFLLGGIFILRSEMFSEEAFRQRLDLARSALLMVRSSPVFGVGLNNFIPRLPDFWRPSGQTYLLQPVHNIYLLIAAETGIIGLGIFLCFLFLIFQRLRRGKLSISNYQLTIALTLILLLGILDHYWLTLQQTQLVFAVVLGMAWSNK